MSKDTHITRIRNLGNFVWIRKKKNKGPSDCMSTIPLWYGDLAERKEGGTTTNTNISYLIFIYIYSRCVGFLYNKKGKRDIS
jgi:hypothetical protein